MKHLCVFVGVSPTVPGHEEQRCMIEGCRRWRRFDTDEYVYERPRPLKSDGGTNVRDRLKAAAVPKAKKEKV